MINRNNILAGKSNTNESYVLGIIDNLTKFDAKKTMEYASKRLI
jgi:hypothetical protein